MIGYANIGAVCSDCARKAGFVPKKKTVGMWVGECDICHKERPCTDLWHDWVLTKKKGKRGGEMNELCSLCSLYPHTGEFFCAYIGEWVERCPNLPGGNPWEE